jgi:hypothetical protein
LLALSPTNLADYTPACPPCERWFFLLSSSNPEHKVVFYDSWRRQELGHKFHPLTISFDDRPVVGFHYFRVLEYGISFARDQAHDPVPISGRWISHCLSQSRAYGVRTHHKPARCGLPFLNSRRRIFCTLDSTYLMSDALDSRRPSELARRSHLFNRLEY